MAEPIKTHWKKAFNPDYLGAYAFQPDEEKTLTIASISTEMVTGPDAKKEQCSVIYWQEKEKPMILNVTNSKTIQKLMKSPYIEDWIKKRITLIVKTVSAFGEKVDAVRVKNELPAPLKTPICAKCGQIITATAEFTVKQIINAGMNKFGTTVCMDCAKESRETKEIINNENDAD